MNIDVDELILEVLHLTAKGGLTDENFGPLYEALKGLALPEHVAIILGLCKISALRKEDLAGALREAIEEGYGRARKG